MHEDIKSRFIFNFRIIIKNVSNRRDNPYVLSLFPAQTCEKKIRGGQVKGMSFPLKLGSNIENACRKDGHLLEYHS